VKPNNRGLLPRRCVICRLSAAIAKLLRGGDLTSGRTCIGTRDLAPVTETRLCPEGEPSGDVRGDGSMVSTRGVVIFSWGEYSLEGEDSLSGVGGWT
jgi:hypothetical protein